MCPGYRHPYTGALTSVGERGYSWSSAVSETSGLYLSMGTTWVNPGNANNRANGFQVRCLQHLPAPCLPSGGRPDIITGMASSGVPFGYGGRAERMVNSATHWRAASMPSR